MFPLVIRILFFLAVFAGAYFLLARIFNSGDAVKCSRCEGKGYWYGTRGRETCDWCKGSGELPREKHS